MAFSVTVDVVVEPDEGGFHAFSPVLKGLHADGASVEEALRNFTAEIPAYIISLLKHGDPLPLGTVVQQHESLSIPPGAFLRHVQQNVTLPWPSVAPSGIS